MRRAVILGALVVIGALSSAVAARLGLAQQGAQTITVDKVKDNLYVLKGGGGNTAVFVRSDGVVVVDAKNPGWGKPILDKIKELTPKPVTLLINTHTHGDHVSGNVEFPETVEIVVQENTRANMAKMDIFAKNANRGMPARTFENRMTLGRGADQVDLYYFGPGHTNGDAWVVFPAARTAHLGDLFPRKGLPLVDGSNGGSVLRYPETLRKGHDGIAGVDTIINGHNDTTTTWDDLRVFAEFNQDFLTWARAQLQAGRTPEQAAADWKLPEKYQGYAPEVSQLFGGVAGRLKLLADELRAAGELPPPE
jgi:glyoxylase-like metal-dependent hydrolase (beta-lactamase superfamily II)